MDCSLPAPGVYPNPCPLSRWCDPIISSPVIPFSSCPQSFPTSGSFQMSQLFKSGGQSIGVSASTSVLPMKTQGYSSWDCKESDRTEHTHTHSFAKLPNPAVIWVSHLWLCSVSTHWPLPGSYSHPLPDQLPCPFPKALLSHLVPHEWEWHGL